jgi:hypothetical protein
MTAFNGFPPETLRFLHELRVNNRKDWFEALWGSYERFWLVPAQAFVVAAGEVLAEFAPEIQAEPQVLGSIFASIVIPGSVATPGLTGATSTSGSGRASGAARSPASSPGWRLSSWPSGPAATASSLSG